jgi:hypothetical protein
MIFLLYRALLGILGAPKTSALTAIPKSTLFSGPNSIKTTTHSRPSNFPLIMSQPSTLI